MDSLYLPSDSTNQHQRLPGTAVVAELARRVSNWGRWGPDDQLGTLNFITPAKVAHACTLVSAGRVIALGVPLDKDGPQRTAPRRYNPIHFMDELPMDYVLPGGVGVADDVLVLPLQATTQWDSLAHVSHNGKLYGGRSAQLVTSHGALTNSVRSFSDRVIGRGILADVATYHGVDTLPPGHEITAQELDDVLRAERVAVEEGDILLVRTGFLNFCRSNNWDGYHGDAPGLGVNTTVWLHEKSVAAVAADTASLEVKPFSVHGVAVPFHIVALVYMGMLLGEIFDLEQLAADCRTDGRYEFLFIAPPLPVTAGVGSPVNPYAVK